MLDGSAAAYFGIAGPSAFSLLAWAEDVARYQLDLGAQDELDLAPAQIASAHCRAHVLQLIGAGTNPVLNHNVQLLRQALGDPGYVVSDEDVARHLVGIAMVSTAATYRAFVKGFTMYASGFLTPARRLSFPAEEPSTLYEHVIATQLARCQRGALDAVYRVYQGTEPRRLQ